MAQGVELGARRIRSDCGRNIDARRRQQDDNFRECCCRRRRAARRSRRRPFSKLDSVRFRVRIGNRGKRLSERRVEVGLLVGIERQQYVMRGRSSRGFTRGRAVDLEFEPIRCVSPVDRVDRLEHRNMQHRLGAGVGSVRKLLFDAYGIRLRIPVHDHVAARRRRQQRRSEGPNEQIGKRRSLISASWTILPGLSGRFRQSRELTHPPFHVVKDR